MAATRESVIQTVVKKIRHSDFQTLASAATQTVDILVPSSADTTYIWVQNVVAFVSEAWAATAPSLAVGTVTGTVTDFMAGLSGSTAGVGKVSDGPSFKTASITVTTTGANTGTAGAGLSLIGNTTTVNQATNLMNDFRALQEDLDSLEASLADTRVATGSFSGFTAGNGVIATLTLGAGTWASKTAGEYIIVVEYVNFSAL